MIIIFIRYNDIIMLAHIGVEDHLGQTRGQLKVLFVLQVLQHLGVNNQLEKILQVVLL